LHETKPSEYLLGLAAQEFVDTCAYFIQSPDFVCNGNSEESQGLEIQDVVSMMISVASGSDAMSYEEFIT
jgi:hypothetical protein